MPKMAYKSKSSSKPAPVAKAAYGGEYKDRNLMSMSPEQCQEDCKPTDAEPVRMHAKMAGCA